MRTVIEVSFDTTCKNKVVAITIPYDAKVRFSRDERNRLYFAFEIYGHLYRPQIQDIIRTQHLYGVKSYKCVSEFMKGETLDLICTY